MARVRLFFTGLILILLMGAGTTWLLSNENVIPSIWSPSLGTAFSVLGVLIAFVQWTLPLSPSDPKPSAESAKSSHARDTFLKQIYDRIIGRKGALVVYEKRENVGENIELNHRDANDHYETVKANIVERIVEGYPLFAAIFPSLDPDTYRVSGPGSRSESITVFAGHAAEIDWRKDEARGYSWEREAKAKEKAEQRGSSQAALRLQSVMIGLGGALFLAHKYMGLPYLDIVGVILIVSGIANLLTTLVLDWLGWLKNKYATYGNVFVRPWIMVIELGGVLYFAHRYTTFPHLDIVGIVVMALGVVALVISLFAAYG